jgi:hypothetical protein
VEKIGGSGKFLDLGQVFKFAFFQIGKDRSIGRTNSLAMPAVDT